jgi:hypothetical protein
MPNRFRGPRLIRRACGSRRFMQRRRDADAEGSQVVTSLWLRLPSYTPRSHTARCAWLSRLGPGQNMI